MDSLSADQVQRMLHQLSNFDEFEMAYREARQWEAAMKTGDANVIGQLDFSVTPVCKRCSKACFDKETQQWKAKRCSGCQAVIFCSRSCQVAEWKQPLVPRAQPHKELCAANKVHMERVPYFQAQVKIFPWGRLESDDTCPHDLIKARMGVLGSGSAFGYWSVPGGAQAHDESPGGPVLYEDLPTGKRKANYIHGEVLLGSEWPTDAKSWKLKGARRIPRLSFTEKSPPPAQVVPGQVKDWRSWYEWRGLSLESPAALIMDFPLSAYYLLVDVLGVIDPERSPTNRQKLNVHYLGAEVELNFLPLYSELALLLPNTDITLTFFSKATHKLVQRARKSHPESLATRDVVWSYTAPKKCGSGSIEIKLAECDVWDKFILTDGEIPDAMIASNAGLLVYPEWVDPMLFSIMLDIPFGVTEYAEQSMELCARDIPRLSQHQAPVFTTPGSNAHINMTRNRAFPITVNPFHRPGQRSLPSVRMPNFYNGFAMPIVMHSRREAKR